jgi:putative protease
MPEERIGQVINYFAKPQVAAIEVQAGSVKIGDRLHYVGHTTDFESQVNSMQEERQAIDEALPGQQIGIQVPDRVRPGDQVFKVS